MSVCLVTGAAGFIGSHLSEQLLAAGHTVRGLDAFIPYYPRAVKEENLAVVRRNPRFELYELDLRTAELAPVLDGVDVVFHLAAMAGLLRSWEQFELYLSCNALATQRLLAAAAAAKAQRFIHCSTSSVYGRFATGNEELPLRPVSPYGITKLAAEQLCHAYGEKDDLPYTILRLFSVYGPRQRPDMGYHIFIRKLLAGETIVVDGDGTDSRSNTFVADCVQGIMTAGMNPAGRGEIFNIGGGQEVTVNEVLDMLAELTGQEPHIAHGPPRPGDQRRTAADVAKARTLLGYAPQVGVFEGLRRQVAWQRAQTP